MTMKSAYYLYFTALGTASFHLCRRSRRDLPLSEQVREIRQFLAWANDEHGLPAEMASGFIAWLAREAPSEPVPLLLRDSLPIDKAPLYVIRCDTCDVDGRPVVERDGQVVNLRPPSILKETLEVPGRR